MKSIDYRPEIDGLRAFAVIPVILFHLGYQWIKGGFIGVDVFFVISGFLITSIVVKELESNTFSLRGFWARRIRRIFPAMIVVTAVSLAFAYFLVFKGDHRAIGKQAVASLVSLANVYFWRNTGDYWGSSAEQSPFLHTWSLSVEEQFYVTFPLIIWLVFIRRPRLMQGAFLTIVVISLFLFLRGSIDAPLGTFYLLPTRAWELAVGCFLAVAPRDNTQRPSLGNVGFCLILLSYVAVPGLNGGLAIGVLGASLIISCARCGVCYAILSNRFVVLLGKMSFSLYLWHWPVIVYARYFNLDEFKLPLLIPMLILSAISYYLVEQTTRRRKGVIPIIAGAYIATFAFAWALVVSEGVYDASAFERPKWYGLYYDLKPGNELGAEFMAMSSSVTMPPRTASPDSYKKGGIIVGSGAPRVVVLGDSHGVMWCDTIRKVIEDRGVACSFWAMNAISPFMQIPAREESPGRYLTSQEKLEYDKARIELITRWKPDVVILGARWSTVPGPATDDLLTFLSQHARHILLIEQPPELTIENKNVLQYMCYLGIAPDGATRQYFPTAREKAGADGRNLIRALASRYPRCRVVPTFDLYANAGKALILDGKNVVYLDDDHLTSFGTELASERIRRALDECLADKTPVPSPASATEKRE